jgi:hypothetical protein
MDYQTCMKSCPLDWVLCFRRDCPRKQIWKAEQDRHDYDMRRAIDATLTKNVER